MSSKLFAELKYSSPAAHIQTPSVGNDVELGEDEALGMEGEDETEGGSGMSYRAARANIDKRRRGAMRRLRFMCGLVLLLKILRKHLLTKSIHIPVPPELPEGFLVDNREGGLNISEIQLEKPFLLLSRR